MSALTDADGPAAPPRLNGELVFNQPWESRAFGMAVGLHEAGVFEWSHFQAALIARITGWQDVSHEQEAWNYYEHWLGALTDVLADRGAVGDRDVLVRAHSLGERTAGHDHSE